MSPPDQRDTSFVRYRKTFTAVIDVKRGVSLTKTVHQRSETDAKPGWLLAAGCKQVHPRILSAAHDRDNSSNPAVKNDDTCVHVVPCGSDSLGEVYV